MSNYYQPDPTLPDFAEQTDEWHSHGAGEPAPQRSHGEVSPKWISVGLITSFLAVFATIWALAILFKVERDKVVASVREIDTGRDAAEIIARAKAGISTVGWMDEKAGVVHVPVNLAIEETLREYAALQSGAPRQGGRK